MTHKGALAWAFSCIAASAAIAAALYAWLPDSVLVPGVPGGDPIELTSPRWLLLLAATPLLALGMYRSLADLPLLQRWLGLVVRGLVLALLAVALAHPARTTDATRIAVVFLVDVSDSIADGDLERAHRIVEAAWSARGENHVEIVTFARGPRVVTPAPGEARIGAFARHGAPGSAESADSDLALALQLAYALLPPGTVHRVVLASDGSQTRGDILAEVARAAELGIRIDTVALAEGPPAEIAASALVVPDRIRAGEPFTVRARIFASSPGAARVRLYQGETLNGLDAVREVALAEGANDLEFRSIVHVPGPVTYRIEIEPRSPDRFAANNQYTSTVVVPGRPAILLVDGTPSAASHLARALGAGELDVDVRGPRAMPSSIDELSRFDFVIVSDVPADALSASQREALTRYVRDTGGGLLVSGGEHAFGLGGYRDTSLERILPVRMEGEQRRDQPALALALVIDRSGSMSGEKIELAKEAARATAELLAPQDYLEVIGFDAQPERIVRMQSAGNRIAILRDIGRLHVQGGTSIFPALDMSFQDLSVTRAAIKHVILLTDGQTQERGIPELVQVMRAEGITVSTVGVGGDVNRTLLQQAADLGEGRAYFTSDPHNVPRIFVQETTTARRSDVVEEYVRTRAAAPADFLRGIDLGSAPYLRGYVATRARPAPAQVVLESELGEPLLARWRVGLGWSLAWTSDVHPRWCADWLRWRSFSPFWVQLVREHMRQRSQEELPMHAEVVGDEARVTVDAIDARDEFVNALDSTLRVEGPMGAPARERTREQHTLRQVAPGRYEARFPLDRYGSFVLTAEHRREGRLIAESRAQLARPYPREYARPEPDLELLGSIARATGGRREPSSESLFDSGDEQVRSREDAWAALLFAALMLFVVDLLLRRVRIFDRRFTAAR